MEKCLYRTETAYGEGYRIAAEVMAHEVFELKNTDILETLSTTILKDTPMGEKLDYLMKVIECEVEDEEMENFLEEAFHEPQVGVKYMEEVINVVNEKTGKNIKYCLWLATKENVNEYYGDNKLKDYEYDAYETSDVILSDIGDMGYLFGYENDPIPVDDGSDDEDEDDEE